MVTVRVDATFCTQKCGVYYRRKANSLPDLMRKSTRFVRFNAKKVPFTVAGKPASTTNPATWSTFDEARKSHIGKGIGYVLGDGVGCIDLDHCISDGVVADWAQKLLDANPGTFTEVSISGDGLHIFGLLEEAPGHVMKDGGRSVEVYSQGRYIALTGNRHGKSPSALKPLVVF